nr:hypothetical protein [Tanacetum cinerariifolium]
MSNTTTYLTLRVMMTYPPLRLSLPFELEWDRLPRYTIRSLNSSEWRKIIFGMITSMGFCHAKAYTLRGRSSTKLGKGLAKSKPMFFFSAKAFLPRLSETWKPINCYKNSLIPSKPDHAYICTISGAIRNEKELWDLRKHRTGKEAGEEGTPKKDRDRFSPYRGPSYELLSTLSKSPREILATEKAARSFKQPPHSAIPLVGFSGEKSWPLGEVPLKITIGEGPLTTKKTLNFVIVGFDSPHNIILGRTTMQPMGIVVSTIHGAIKFYMPQGIDTILSQYNPRETKEEQRATNNRHRKATANKNQNKVTRPPEDVCRLLRMDYRTHDGGPENSNNRRRNLQHRPYNKRPQTLRTSEPEEEKTSARKKRSDSHPSEGAYKGQNFTRSQVSDRLIDKVFNYQLGRNMEVNVGDIVIKSDVEEEMLANIKETLDGIRAINLKLNPKKCSFGVEEGIFSGHLNTKQGIKENPSKVKAISDVQPPKSILARPEKSGRIAKWAIELGEHEIEFRERNLVNGQILADFLAETPSKEEEGAKDEEAKRKEPEPKKHGKFSLIKPQALTALEQLVANQVNGLLEARQTLIKQYLEKAKELLANFPCHSIEHIKRDQNKKAYALSKLASMTFSKLAKEVLVEVIQDKSIMQKEVTNVTQEKEDSCMIPIQEYLQFGKLPDDP